MASREEILEQQLLLSVAKLNGVNDEIQTVTKELRAERLRRAAERERRADGGMPDEDVPLGEVGDDDESNGFRK